MANVSRWQNLFKIDKSTFRRGEPSPLLVITILWHQEAASLNYAQNFVAEEVLVDVLLPVEGYSCRFVTSLGCGTWVFLIHPRLPSVNILMKL